MLKRKKKKAEAESAKSVLPDGWEKLSGPDGTSHARKWVDGSLREVITAGDEELIKAVNSVQDELDGRALKVEQDAHDKIAELRGRAEALVDEHGEPASK